jgi:hypothetical protein
MTPILLNALNVNQATFTTPRVGVWVADLEVDLDVTGIVPTGKAILTVGTTPLTCTIDDRSSGPMGQKASIQVVGGGGGWDKIVSALHLHNDAGVTSANVFSATAAEIGEVVVDAIPTALGTDYVRLEGPAAGVLDGFEWYVDASGVTIIGTRPTVPSLVQVLDWDPNERVATLAGDELVLPGSLLVDTRFGSAIVRDVEQTFGPDGARATAWCDTDSDDDMEAGTRLARGLAILIDDAAGVRYLRHYRYRVIGAGPDKRLTLQVVDTESGAPEVLTLVEAWVGFGGGGVIPAPGSQVLVVFVDGDPSQPVCVAFAPAGAAALDPFVKGTELTAALTALVTALGVFSNVAVNPLIAAASIDSGAALLAACAACLTALPLTLSTKNFQSPAYGRPLFRRPRPLRARHRRSHRRARAGHRPHAI